MDELVMRFGAAEQLVQTLERAKISWGDVDYVGVSLRQLIADNLAGQRLNAGGVTAALGLAVAQFMDWLNESDHGAWLKLFAHHMRDSTVPGCITALVPDGQLRQEVLANWQDLARHLRW